MELGSVACGDHGLGAGVVAGGGEVGLGSEGEGAQDDGEGELAGAERHWLDLWQEFVSISKRRFPLRE